MFGRMLIRKKILCVTVLLTGTLMLLLYISLQGVLAYRQLTKSIGALSYEVQEMWSLGQEVASLRDELHFASLRDEEASLDYRAKPSTFDRANFLAQADVVRDKLSAHQRRINNQFEFDPLLAASRAEVELTGEIQQKLKDIEAIAYDNYFPDAHSQLQKIGVLLDEISMDAHSLFHFMTDRMRDLRADMRSRYHTWIAIILLSATSAMLIVLTSFYLFRKNVVQPFKLLLDGSRRIAGGEFQHRIHLRNQDELAELADAQNKMTDRFVEINNHLNEKVQQRTREVVRSEQLASVGFLAAGVAHEINNPLASIAWSAEALESRLHEILHCSPSDSQARQYDEEELEILRKYLKRIQDEAFRCKGITERLLDFSRLGESQKKCDIDIHESVSDVIALVKHLGQYRNRTVTYQGEPGTIASVSPTEFKQVVLNLLTNSLDASDDGGVVNVQLKQFQDHFELVIRDTGCGMTEEVIQHLFEPFFTRRRDGRGTGLGLSITYRIVQDHGGDLVPSSDGPGQGSTFVLTLPYQTSSNRDYESLKAAA